MRSNELKKALWLTFLDKEDSDPRNTAQRAGVKVRAQSPDITTETAIVIANCLYIVPAKPPMKETGTKTAHRTRTIATKAPETSSIAFIEASRADNLCSHESFYVFYDYDGVINDDSYG